MSEGKDEFPEIDDKTKAVFNKKGYQLLGKIGSGAFGQVYKARNFHKDQMCAVKVMDIMKMTEKVREKFLPRELAALMEVKHPNAIRVLDIFKMSKKVYVFMEFAGNGDLSGYVIKNKRVDERLAKRWFRQSSEAVAYMHDEIKMAHRDIKLDNILLDEDGNAKLTDFGFARLDENLDGANLVSITYCGTVPYYSPQLVAKKPYNPFLADVWAMGVVLYAMLCGRFPFHFQDIRKLYREQTDYPRYIRSRFFEHVCPDARNLVEWMCTPDEKHRPSMSDVLKHEWLN